MSSVWDAAQAAIQTLKSLGYTDCCFVGGVACALYGNSRTPKDLDIFIMNTSDGQESIKQRIVAANSKFYLIPGKRPGANYKVLWYDAYRTSFYGLTPTRASLSSIKVDILIPGIMDIPSFPANRITSLSPPSRSITLPTAPFSLILLLKLQAWSQHRASPEYHYSKEQYKDKLDLECLVPIAAGKGLKPRQEAILPASFLTKADERVLEYLRAYNTSSTTESWKKMGFKVPSNAHSSTSTVTSSIQRSTPAFSSNFVETTRFVSQGTSTLARKYNVKPLPKPKPLYSSSTTKPKELPFTTPPKRRTPPPTRIYGSIFSRSTGTEWW